MVRGQSEALSVPCTALCTYSTAAVTVSGYNGITSYCIHVQLTLYMKDPDGSSASIGSQKVVVCCRPKGLQSAGMFRGG